jgi:Ca-activated chloride channel family protein
MSRSHAALGLGLSTIGVGTEFDVELMRGLAYDGAGTFYFLENPGAVLEVFTEEVDRFLVPLGEDARIDLDVGANYELRNIYGTQTFSVDPALGQIQIPSLHLAHRTSADDNTNGRRGGGGAIVAELLPRQELDPDGDPGHVGTITLDYLPAGGQERDQQTVKIISPLDPGDTPDDGFFLGDSVEKGFVTLNILVGFQMATQRADAFDDAGALNVLLGLRDNVAAWLASNQDADIEDDLRYLDLFIENLRDRGAEDPPDTRPLPEPWPQD